MAEKIDPEIRAELVKICEKRILALLLEKDRSDKTGEDLAFQVCHAAGELVESDAELLERLIAHEDDTVELSWFYRDTWTDSRSYGGSPQDYIQDLKVGLGTDVATAYAMESPEVQAIEVERRKLKEDINP